MKLVVAVSWWSSLNPPNLRTLKPSFFFKTPKIKAEVEIRVCVNKSCSKLGSRQTLQTLSDLSPPNISVKSCGCLGRCGAGPNLVVLPDGVLVSHCETAARAAEVLAGFYGGDGGWDAFTNLEALALRKRGENAMKKGDFLEAENLLSQAIDLNPGGGLQISYTSRSAVRLALGNNSAALEDAKEASKICPRFPQAYIAQGDAFLAMEEWDAAEEAYSSALLIDPSIRRSKSFKARVVKLQERLATVDVSA
eukprot:TRINITY_DN4587_c0_g1_i1.p1 TRINITY_DN4587_c0_g1~~TRINITY_DN4587_c0_g1_i1.p1  ORF type:complete len:251 (+),score=41.89 TRINITY_DN4587_c0_g1_i1:111-863(+)